MLTLTPGAATLAQLETIWREGLAVRLDDSARPGIEASAARIEAAAAGDAAGAGAAAGAAAVAPTASTTAITEPCLTLSPSATLSSLTTPAWLEGISMEALSDSTVISDCSALTVSPTFTSNSMTPTSSK